MADRLILDEFVPFLLSVTSNRVSSRIATAYEALFGLSIPEWRLITVVAEGQAITQAEIGERTRMDKVTVSRAAIALTQRGLLERSPNSQDRRSHHLMLSTAGRTLYAEVVPKAAQRAFRSSRVGLAAARPVSSGMRSGAARPAR